MDLSTKYMGLTLKNPLIISSSKLTSSLDNIKKYAENGAGAIVLKSLFEEQILDAIQAKLDDYPMYFWYPEASEYIKNISKGHGVNEYIRLLTDAKKAIDIPVIASINCTSAYEWPAFAAKLEEAGADAIELNISVLPFKEDMDSKSIENIYIDILKAVKAEVNIPVSVKIGPYFTNLYQITKDLKAAGADGVVLFNRFFRPDINIDDESIIYDNYLSAPEEMSMPLRWIGLLSHRVDVDFAASTGVHDYAAVIKQLMAGAAATQICTAIYKFGAEYIDALLKDMQEWMAAHKYKTLADLKGKVVKDKKTNMASFERMQFMKKTTV